MENTVAVKTPDFQVLLESLQKETERNREVVNRVGYLSGQLKRIERKDEPTNPSETKEPSCIIDHLWQQIWMLREQNEELQVISDHLQGLVGA
jgi:hypothetical protein